MACLPYDALNIFDMTSETPTHNTLTLSTISGENVSDTLAAGIEPVSSGTSYGNIFSILKVILSFSCAPQCLKMAKKAHFHCSKEQYFDQKSHNRVTF